MRVQNLAVASGAMMGAKAVVYLDDGTLIHFVYRVTGLEDFATECGHSGKLALQGREVAVLHLKLIADFLKCQRGLKRPR